MPQLQYQSLTQPPELTPPTTDALGWRPSLPSASEIRYQSCVHQRPDAYQTHEQTTGATIFAVEQWAIPGQTVGTFHGPTSPLQFINRREYQARGGGYRQMPWVTKVFPQPGFTELGWDQFIGPDDIRFGKKLALSTAAMQDASADGWFDLPADILPLTVYPNTTIRRSLTIAAVPFVSRVDDFPSEAFQDLVTFPDGTVRRSLPTAQLPAVFRTDVVTETVTTVTVEYPDTTTRASLSVNRFPFLFKGEAIEQFDRTVALAIYPDTTTRLALDIAEIPYVVRTPSATDFTRVLMESVRYPNTTRRATLPIADLPYTFRGEAVEQFARTLLVSTQYPDTTRQARLSPSAYPSVFRLDPVTQVFHVASQYPATTARTALKTAAIPTTFRGEAIEQFARTLLATATYPDSTRRLSLHTATFPRVDPVGDVVPPVFTPRAFVVYPDTTTRPALSVAQHPFLFRIEVPAVPLDWLWIPAGRSPLWRIQLPSSLEVAGSLSSPQPQPPPPTELTWDTTAFPTRPTARRLPRMAEIAWWPTPPLVPVTWLPIFPSHAPTPTIIRLSPVIMGDVGAQPAIAQFAVERVVWTASARRRLQRPQEGVWPVDMTTLLNAAPCVELGDETLVTPILAAETLITPSVSSETLTLPTFGSEDVC